MGGGGEGGGESAMMRDRRADGKDTLSAFFFLQAGLAYSRSFVHFTPKTFCLLRTPEKS